jgi:hypothetical protein
MKSLMKKLVVPACIIAGNIFFACHKDTTTSPPATAASNSVVNTLSAFYQQNGAATQSFTINATSGGSFVGAKGTKFFFPANAFLNSSNQAVTGTINIQVKEIYSAEDMILSNIPTTSGGRGLLSEGEFNLACTQANKPLHLNNGVFLNAHMPLADSAALVDSMQFFTYYNTSWWPCNNYGNSVATIPDSMSITCDSITWCNCDGFYPGGTFYQVTVIPVNSPDLLQTAIYMYVNGHHAIWQLSPSGNNFVTPNDIAGGAPLTIVGLALASNGAVYSAFQSYTNPGSNQTANLTFSSTTTAAFKTQLASLH